jgi:hypothetical protein
MCVLNGSQMHWTREMEELFLSEGSNGNHHHACYLNGFIYLLVSSVVGPKVMYDRQLKQLADMTILVRGLMRINSRLRFLQMMYV